MSDKPTTFRTDYYIRGVPKEGLQNNAKQIPTQDRKLPSEGVEDAKNVAKDFARAGGFLGNVGSATRLARPLPVSEMKKRLLEEYPWIKNAIRSVVDARLQMYNSDDDWSKSKEYGWGEEPYTATHYPPDDNEYFRYAQDDQGLYIEDLPPALAMPYDEYEKARKPFEVWLDNADRYVLSPMTKEEAGDSVNWYPTTNDYLNSIIASELGEKYGDALYALAQEEFLGTLDKDLHSDSPKYSKAISRLYPNAGGKPATVEQNPSAIGDDRNAQAQKTMGDIVNEEGRKSDRILGTAEFERPNAVPLFATNTLVPYWSDTHWDPELNYKTSNKEAGARLAGDIATNALSVALPYGAGRIVGNAMMRPVIGSVIGGALGGAGTYGAKRGGDAILKGTTGRGGIEHPVDMLDLGVEMGAGALSGPFSNLRGIRGANDVRRAMDSKYWSKVTPKEVKDSFKASKKYNSSNKQAQYDYEDLGWKNYRSKYPNGGAEIEMFPPLKVSGDNPTDIIPLATGLPGKTTNKVFPNPLKPIAKKVGGSAKRTSDFLTRGTMDDADKLVGTILDSKGNPIMTTKPQYYIKPDEDFVKNYARENADFLRGIGMHINDGFDVASANDLKALQDLMVKSQEKDSFLGDLFSGEKKVYTDKEMKSNLAHSGGTATDGKEYMENKILHGLYAKNPNQKIGTVNEGKFTPATEKQQEEFNKATAEVAKRKGHKYATKDMLKSARKDQSNWNELGKASLGLSGATNAYLPSYYILGVNPYEYKNPLHPEDN